MVVTSSAKLGGVESALRAHPWDSTFRSFRGRQCWGVQLVVFKQLVQRALPLAATTVADQQAVPHSDADSWQGDDRRQWCTILQRRSGNRQPGWYRSEGCRASAVALWLEDQGFRCRAKSLTEFLAILAARPTARTLFESYCAAQVSGNQGFINRLAALTESAHRQAGVCRTRGKHFTPHALACSWAPPRQEWHPAAAVCNPMVGQFNRLTRTAVSAGHTCWGGQPHIVRAMYILP